MIDNYKQGIAQRRNNKDEKSMWLGQVNNFLKVLHTEDSSESVASYFREYAFMLYINIVGSPDVSIGTVYTALECTGLSWNRKNFVQNRGPGK